VNRWIRRNWVLLTVLGIYGVGMALIYWRNGW
jgi:hypothetical protein